MTPTRQQLLVELESLQATLIAEVAEVKEAFEALEDEVKRVKQGMAGGYYAAIAQVKAMAARVRAQEEAT